MSQIATILTGAIASNAAVKEGELLSGMVVGIRVDILEADGTTASSNTADVTITEGDFNQDILIVTGLTGIENFYRPEDERDTVAGVGQSSYTPFVLTSQRLTVTVANGTDTEIVKVFVKVLE